MKRIVSLFIVLMLAMSSAVFAHPGRTDSSGGHHDYNNVSGLGYYHYHHGMGPHLHPGGVCPYGGASSNSSGNNSSSNKSTSKSSAKADKKKIKQIQKSLDYAVIYDMFSDDYGELTICWDKDSTARGYKIVVAQNAKFTKDVKSVHVSKSKTKKTVKGLKSGKKYYAKIISFKKYKGKRVYSLVHDQMGPVRVE